MRAEICDFGAWLEKIIVQKCGRNVGRCDIWIGSPEPITEESEVIIIFYAGSRCGVAVHDDRYRLGV